MIYMINEWHSSLNNGTACLFRTTKKSEFEAMKKKIIKERRVYKGIARTTRTKTHVIYSFACSGDAYYAFTHLPYTMKPVSSSWEKVKK